jgi:predicted Zn-ribbon and HTH transcriptional regulator
MSGIDPYKCKSCGYVFVAPKLYMARGARVKVCPFCDGKEMEEFEVALDEEELNVLVEVLEKEHPDIPPEKLEKMRRKIEDISKLIKRGEFDLRVRKAESKP